MSYEVFKSDGTKLTDVTDALIDTATISINLVGRDFIDYGQAIAENHLHIMENFAHTVAPANPIIGQLWWDTNIDVLKVYDGSFVPISNLVSDTSPQLGGQLDANNFKIINVNDPTLAQDAATKNYVDNELFALSSLDNLVDDTTPQLGGDLDMNAFQLIPNVGIGIASSSADGTLHVHTASAGVMVAAGDFEDLVVEGSNSTGLSILCPDANLAGIAFGTPADNLASQIVWDASNSILKIATRNSGAQLRFDTADGVEAVRIDSSGNMGIGTTAPDAKLDINGDFRADNFANRNAFINPNFDIWQRGVSTDIGVSPGDFRRYVSDRWQIYSGTAPGDAIATQETFTTGQTDVPGEPEFYLRWNQFVGASDTPNLQQRIEGVRTFAGKTVTLSFYAKVSSGTETASPILQQIFGNGGSPSSVVVYTGADAVMTTTWQKFTRTLTLSDLSGKTVGTNNNDYLGFFFRFFGSTTFTVDFARAQLELGTVATEFDRRPIATELALAQRYYHKSYNLNDAPGLVTVQGAAAYRLLDIPVGSQRITARIDFPVRMRIVPTVTFFSTSTGTTGKALDVTNAVDVIATTTAVGSGSLNWDAGVAVPTDDVNFRVHFTADAEL